VTEYTWYNFIFRDLTALVGSSLLKFQNHTQLDTPHSEGLLWTRDRPVAETSTWQHIK